MYLPIFHLPSESLPNSVCLGYISMLVGSFNVNNNPSKKFLIATALIGSFTNKYKCKPPDLDLTGTTGSLC